MFRKGDRMKWVNDVIELVTTSKLTQTLMLLSCYRLLDHLAWAYAFGIYKSKCNYIIDRNVILFEIKELRKELNL